MSEEITKIFTYLNNQNWYVFEDDYNEPEINHKILEVEEVKILLDYITNLQQENQQLKEKLNCDLKWALKYDELYKQNQQLKESYCNRTDCSGRLHDSRKYPSVKQQLDLYKSVLDEIREYIECSKEHVLEHDGSHIYLTQYAVKDLLQILDKVKE